MADDLSDVYAELRELKRKVRRLERGTPLQNASISRGALEVLSDEGLIVEGSASVTGILNVSGTEVVDGTLRVTGTFEVDGDAEVSGTLSITGPWTLAGTGSITGNVTLDGNFTVDDGKISAGSVRIENGKIYIGDMIFDPASHDGYVKMPNGAELLASGTGIEMYSGGTTKNGLVLTPGGMRVFTLEEAGSATGLHWVGYSPITGKLYDVPPGVGGPIGGPLSWPFPESTVTSEYGPRESPGPGGSTFHEGIDFGVSEGTPIPSAGAGTVTLAGDNGGFGNCVIINHGGGLETLYGHMRDAPSVDVGDVVSSGQTIGLVGNTGVSFGAHLHLEVHVSGSPVNPRSKLS